MSIAVATAEEVDALRAQLARLEAAIEELRSGNTEREVFTPKQIAKRFKLRQSVVYQACASGALACELLPQHGVATYRITLAEARAWRATVGKTNQ